MGFYDSLSATALSLIQRFGAPVVFSRGSGSVYNPSTGSYSGGSTLNISGHGVAVGYKNSEIDGTIIQSGDLKLIVNSLSISPEQNDTIPVNGITYRVMEANPLNPGGVVVIYVCQLRV